MIGTAEDWQKVIQTHKKLRTGTIEMEQNIKEAMTEYLKELTDNHDFNLIYESFGAVKLHCNGDIFDLVQIEDFCDHFALEICITNRIIVENYMTDTTEVKTNYLFTTKTEEE
jgi:hypothetical protein